MYISIKLPPAFGSFNRIRKENYPFNNLFTSYLAAVAELGLNLGMDVEELVGYIEDRVFDGQRLPDVPDVPERAEPVNIRYKINIPEDADESHPGNIVRQYIEGSSLTNRMAVMYIARMTLRMSAAYGTSLFRLTRLIMDLNDGSMQKRKPEIAKLEPVVAKPKAAATEPAVPKVRIKAAEVRPEPTLAVQTPQPASNAAQKAREAVSALAGLAAEVEDTESAVVETNPALSDFL